MVYEPSSGLPAEYCEYLPKGEFKKALPWLAKTFDAAWLRAHCGRYEGLLGDVLEGVEGAMADLELDASQEKKKDKEKKEKSGKKKKDKKPEIVLERSVRNKRKCITTVKGLDQFGVKLGEAAKLMGKKFACGASVVKEAMGETIDIQGDFQLETAELILQKFATEENGITEAVFVNYEKGKRSPTFG